MAPSRARDGPTSKTLPERVGQLYYAYGLFCASHPIGFILFASTFVVLCWLVSLHTFVRLILSYFPPQYVSSLPIFFHSYPLFNLPLPGNVPQHFSAYSYNQSGIDSLPTPVWLNGPPVCYVQQVSKKIYHWFLSLFLVKYLKIRSTDLFTLFIFRLFWRQLCPHGMIN